MGIGRVLLVGAAVGDVGVEHDDRGLLGFGLGCQNGFFDGIRVAAVFDSDGLPAVGVEPFGHIFRKGDSGGALDGDPIVIIQADELGQSQMAGQGCRFGRDTFHEVSVAAHHKGVVIHDVMAGPVEAGGQVPLGHGHADGIGKSLTQWAGRGFDTGRVAVFGVTGGFTAPLPEILDLFQAQVIPCQVQKAVKQHGGVAS
jgi:hypothetical protein